VVRLICTQYLVNKPKIHGELWSLGHRTFQVHQLHLQTMEIEVVLVALSPHHHCPLDSHCHWKAAPLHDQNSNFSIKTTSVPERNVVGLGHFGSYLLMPSKMASKHEFPKSFQ